MNSVKIKIDLEAGAVDLEASESSLDKIFEQLTEFLPVLVEAHQDYGATTSALRQAATAEAETGAGITVTGGEAGSGEAAKKRNSGGTGKAAETYKSVDLGLSAEERRAFKAFYDEKAPTNQSDHVLCVIYWLVKNKKIENVSYDQIYTGLRTVKAKIPKRITSVLANLKLESMITKKDALSGLHHVGEDYVEGELPKSKKADS